MFRAISTGEVDDVTTLATEHPELLRLGCGGSNLYPRDLAWLNNQTACEAILIAAEAGSFTTTLSPQPFTSTTTATPSTATAAAAAAAAAAATATAEIAMADGGNGAGAGGIVTAPPLSIRDVNAAEISYAKARDDELYHACFVGVSKAVREDDVVAVEKFARRHPDVLTRAWPWKSSSIPLQLAVAVGNEAVAELLARLTPLNVVQHRRNVYSGRTVAEEAACMKQRSIAGAILNTIQARLAKAVADAEAHAMKCQHQLAESRSDSYSECSDWSFIGSANDDDDDDDISGGRGGDGGGDGGGGAQDSEDSFEMVDFEGGNDENAERGWVVCSSGAQAATSNDRAGGTPPPALPAVEPLLSEVAAAASAAVDAAVAAADTAFADAARILGTFGPAPSAGAGPGPGAKVRASSAAAAAAKEPTMAALPDRVQQQQQHKKLHIRHQRRVPKDHLVVTHDIHWWDGRDPRDDWEDDNDNDDDDDHNNDDDDGILTANSCAAEARRRRRQGMYSDALAEQFACLSASSAPKKATETQTQQDHWNNRFNRRTRMNLPKHRYAFSPEHLREFERYYGVASSRHGLIAARPSAGSHRYNYYDTDYVAPHDEERFLRWSAFASPGDACRGAVVFDWHLACNRLGHLPHCC